MTEAIAIRQASNQGDLSFFFSATLRANYLQSTLNRLIPRATYFQEHKKVLDRVLARSSSHLLVACEEAEPDFILGFVLAEPVHGVLHFTYVKKALRRFGIMTRLMKAADIDLDNCEFSHWTFDMAALLARRPDSTRRFNPYLLLPKAGEQ